MVVNVYDIIWVSNKKKRPTETQLEFQCANNTMYILLNIENELHKKFGCYPKSFHYKQISN